MSPERTGFFLGGWTGKAPGGNTVTKTVKTEKKATENKAISWESERSVGAEWRVMEYLCMVSGFCLCVRNLKVNLFCEVSVFGSSPSSQAYNA